jgi:3-hydroxyacyl-CoA dehydrogenase/enoyl-CoA hydratase/3-hydroxybutyryl-CoA epimerase
MIDRMLFAEALETRSASTRALMTTADATSADHGHRLPAVHRWLAQYIVGYQGAGGIGKDAFVARAKELAAKYATTAPPAHSPSSAHLVPRADVKVRETTASRTLSARDWD